MAGKILFRIALVFMLGGISLQGQTNTDLHAFSPKLRAFLAADQARLRILHRILDEDSGGLQFKFFYFYTYDESASRSTHDYSDDQQVRLIVRENQQPVDEFFGIVFEAVSAEREDSISATYHLAQTGQIKREDFPARMNRMAFDFQKRLRDLLLQLNLSQKEKVESYFFNRQMLYPDKFEDFVPFAKKMDPLIDLNEYYETMYDSFRTNQ